MALGIHPIYARVTSATDTELYAAPGARQRVHLRWVTVDVEVAWSANDLARLEAGVGGEVIATLDAGDNNNRIERSYHVNKGSRGRPLPVNTALNLESNGTAGVLVVNGEVEVTGA